VGTASARRNPILYRVTHAEGVIDIDVDQSAMQDVWVSLGQFTFAAGAGSVDMSNQHVSEPGVLLADAVKWELLQIAPLVPEPAAAMLVAVGAAVVSACCRRRRRIA